MPQSMMRLSNLARGNWQVAPCPTSLLHHPPLARRGERESPSHDNSLLGGYLVPRPFVLDGLVVAWCTCTVEEKNIIVCPGTRTPTAGVEPAIQDIGSRKCPLPHPRGIHHHPMGKWLHVMTSHPVTNPAQ